MFVLQVHPHLLIVRILKWGIYGLAVFRIAELMWVWSWTLRFFGPDTVVFYRRMRLLDRGGTSPVIFFNFWLRNYGVLIMLSALFFRTNWLCLGVFLLAHVLQSGVFIHVPPFVLLLSSSNESVTNLHARMLFTVWPLGVTSLTRIYKKQLVFDSFARQRSARQALDDSWGDTVRALMEMAKLIVLDTREPTPAVLQESELLVNLALQFKTLLIRDVGDGQPEDSITEALPFNCDRFRASAYLDEAQVLKFLALLKAGSVGKLPTLARPTADLVRGPF
jgi:hypothetical protein